MVSWRCKNLIGDWVQVKNMTFIGIIAKLIRFSCGFCDSYGIFPSVEQNFRYGSKSAEVGYE